MASGCCYCSPATGKGVVIVAFYLDKEDTARIDHQFQDGVWPLPIHPHLHPPFSPRIYGGRADQIGKVWEGACRADFAYGPF